MFDLTSDQNEMISIYGRTEHAELQRELEAELALVLSDPTLPMSKRRELEKGMEAIRCKSDEIDQGPH